MNSTYDSLEFVSYPSPERHPDRLATIAHLFGLSAAAVEGARILEVGCSTGIHLIAQAQLLPGAEFEGIDLSAAQIEKGQELIRQLGLCNISLSCKDVGEVPLFGKKFDYIFCHGVYSWVPRETQKKIVTLIANLLSDNGVALVSYNCLPGWSVRGRVRSMLQLLDQPEKTPAERAAHAREMMKKIEAEQIDDQSPAGMQVREELKSIVSLSDSYIFHELLAEINHPLTFREFIDHLRGEELQYLGDSRFSRIRFDRLQNFAPGDIAEREYFSDLLYPVALRSTLLCKSSVNLSRVITLARARECYLTSFLAPISEKPDLISDAAEEFRTMHDATVSVSDPLLKHALMRLHTVRPFSHPAEQLFDEAAAAAGISLTREKEHEFFSNFLSYFSQGLVEFNINAPRFVTVLPKRPKVSSLVRTQAQQQEWVTNACHEYAVFGEFERHVLRLLDGEHDSNSMVKKLAADLSLGMSHPGGAPVTSVTEREKIIREYLPQALESIRQSALLLPD